MQLVLVQLIKVLAVEAMSKWVVTLLAVVAALEQLVVTQLVRPPVAWVVLELQLLFRVHRQLMLVVAEVVVRQASSAEVAVQVAQAVAVQALLLQTVALVAQIRVVAVEVVVIPVAVSPRRAVLVVLGLSLSVIRTLITIWHPSALV
jgi:hypothetical protein